MQENAAALEQLKAENIIARIWNHDHTVWSEEGDEITNRLGWLEIPGKMQGEAAVLSKFAEELWEGGFRAAILLGMGGSSLAPEVFRKLFGVGDRGLNLQVLDSTDPEVISRVQANLDLEETVFIVATKSGTTVETLSLFKYFYNHVASEVGPEGAGAHFIAITDAGSNLADLAEEFGFRRLFLNDPDLGGRYSALSHFGLVPAASIGVNLKNLLERAMEASQASRPSVPIHENQAALIGAAMAEQAAAGRDKLTFLISPLIEPLGDWIEQLIAESTGKGGKGILPVVGEPVGKPNLYGSDRAFVHLRLDGDSSLDSAVADLEQAGHPVLHLPLRDRYDLGAQMFYWELATAIAGHRLGIHPFNQPNVEAAKVRAREMVASYQQQGELPQEEPILVAGEMTAYWGGPMGDTPAPRATSSVESLMTAFLGEAQPGSYLSAQAYLTPSEDMDRQLRTLQVRLRDRTRMAVTIGYGPRFLHSTGQLHKGDAGKGLFLQLTDAPSVEVPIPDQAGGSSASISFGTLKRAQALGDRQALAEAGRTVIRIDLGEDPAAAFENLLRAIGG